jgi:protein tyrosine phosphatase (PTP) superfamily phosphohydrolase (DUF442 family)
LTSEGDVYRRRVAAERNAMNDPRHPELAPDLDGPTSAGRFCSTVARRSSAVPGRPWAGLAALLLALPFVASQLHGAPAADISARPPEVEQLLPNAKAPLPGVLTGGAPASAEGFVALAAAGYQTYVDLRTAAEAGTAEETATAAGLTYVRIPVGGEGDLDLTAARALDAVLDAPGRGPVVVACASGNRAGALLAVRAFWLEGLPAVEALELGRRGGVSGMEPVVRTLLGLAAGGGK